MQRVAGMFLFRNSGTYIKCYITPTGAIMRASTRASSNTLYYLDKTKDGRMRSQVLQTRAKHQSKKQKPTVFSMPSPWRFTFPPQRNDLVWGAITYDYLKWLNLSHNVKFINFSTRKNTDGSMTITVKHRKKTPVYSGKQVSWSGIKYTTKKKIGPFTTKTYRRGNGRSTIMFVKGYKNFYEYVAAIQHGEVTKAQHKKLWSALRKQQAELPGTDLVNENLVLGVLHFKLM